MSDPEKETSKKSKKRKTSHADVAAADATTTATATSGSSSNKKKKSGLPKKDYEERLQAVNVISHPMASKKSTKKLYKLVHKAASSKTLRRGVKEVVKALRKGEQGMAVLAGDIFPIDVVSHLPVLLEEHEVPYLFVPSKQDLGSAASTKRPTSCVLIKGMEKNDDYLTLVQEAKQYDPSKLGK